MSLLPLRGSSVSGMYVIFNLNYLAINQRHTYIPLTLYPRRGSRGILDIFTRRPRFTIIALAMRNTADVTGSKPIAV
jgi:hypothetical protein